MDKNFVKHIRALKRQEQRYSHVHDCTLGYFYSFFFVTVYTTDCMDTGGWDDKQSQSSIFLCLCVFCLLR